MRRSLWGVVVTMLLLAFLAPIAHSAEPPRNTGLTHWWVPFFWGQDGWSNVIPVSQPGPANLYVTDLYCRGDVFDVYDNGVLIGSTSMVAVDEECDDLPHRDNPRHAYLDPTYSSGLFELGASEGGHELRLRATQNFIGFGGAMIYGRNLDGG
jgi:hypothetical protein